MCRYIADKVSIFVFVEISINFTIKNCGIFVAKSSEKWYSNRKLYGTGRLIGHHGDRNYTSIQIYRYKPEKERVRI